MEQFVTDVEHAHSNSNIFFNKKEKTRNSSEFQPNSEEL